MPGQQLKLENNLTWLLWQKSLVTAYFQLPIIVLFWQDLGLSLFQVMLLQSIFSAATVLLELPSGIFADLFGRKRALVIASVCNVVGIALYCIADGFWLLLAAELFLAGFVALQSGADSALLYDNLKALNREDEYARVLGNMIYYSTLLLAVTNVVGGFVGAWDLRSTLYLCLPFVVMALFCSLKISEPPVHRDLSGASSGQAYPGPALRQQIRDILAILGGDHTLAWIIVYAGVILTFNQAGLWLYQPYFAITGVEVMYFGVIFALFQVVAAFAGKYYYLARRLMGEQWLLPGLALLSCSASLLMGEWLFLFSFVLVFLHQIVRGFYKVIFSDLINRRVPSEVRASILSVQNLAGRIMIALIMPLFGWYADIYDAAQAFTLIGIVGLVSTLPVWWVLHQYQPWQPSGQR